MTFCIDTILSLAQGIMFLDFPPGHSSVHLLILKQKLTRNVLIVSANGLPTVYFLYLFIGNDDSSSIESGEAYMPPKAKKGKF
jgi:hypothetical protein